MPFKGAIRVSYRREMVGYVNAEEGKIQEATKGPHGW